MPDALWREISFTAFLTLYIDWVGLQGSCRSKQRFFSKGLNYVYA
jgi:hypothetical protein